MTTDTTATVATVQALRLSCNHTIAGNDLFAVPADHSHAGAKVACPKCPARKSGGAAVRRVREVVTGPATPTPAPVTVDTPADAVLTPDEARDMDGTSVDGAIGEVAAINTEVAEKVAAEVQANPEGVTAGIVAGLGTYDVLAARAEWKALKAWTDGGQVGDRPDTANLDALNAAHEAGKPRTGRKAPKAKAPATPKAPKADGLRFYIGDRAMPDSQNKLSSVAWQATKGLGDGGGRLSTKALAEVIRVQANVTNPNGEAWTLTLANGVTIRADLPTA